MQHVQNAVYMLYTLTFYKVTDILCDMHNTLQNIFYKRQAYCKSGRRSTKKAFLTKGYRVWLKNDDWMWDSEHFHQVKKMLGTFTLANVCALNANFSFVFVMEWQSWRWIIFWIISWLFGGDQKQCLKGKKLDLSPYRILTITKANLECSIIYKMAVRTLT